MKADGSFTYRNKKGEEISREEAARLGEDRSYKQVGFSKLKTGWQVSTVWLGGMDISMKLNGEPQIFETMVFKANGNDGHDYDCRRYATEEEALAGHAEVVAKWSDPLRDALYRLGDREDTYE